MRTIGIDPGTAIMGWGVIEHEGQEVQLVDYGALTTPAKTPLPARLKLLHQGLLELLTRYRPQSAAVEELFFSKNVTTALAVGHARGVALLSMANADIPVFEYKPMEVKQAVVGYGRADKAQMQDMVRMTLQMDHTPYPDDAADALAIAICHAYTGPLRARIEES